MLTIRSRSESDDDHNFEEVIGISGIFEISNNYIQRRQWQPTPVLLPEKSHGGRSLVGCCLWGHTESDTTEVT